ncbi:hypothetical protein [Zhihengliuella sp.]|uniref:hypothetical protein n=1 Tax=Zhihengliuella sp. TaxID=1954483 RepID=UPI002811C46E|nr:hypothetical protein [Zhihengliuella sp.]
MSAAHDWESVWPVLEAERPEEAVLLSADPLDVEAIDALPDEYALFEAPLDEYDVVELTHFDQPVARGRVAYGDGFAVLAPVLPAQDDGEVATAHVAAIVARLAENAHGEGAEVLYALVGGEDDAATYAEIGFGPAE